MPPPLNVLEENTEMHVQPEPLHLTAPKPNPKPAPRRLAQSRSSGGLPRWLRALALALVGPGVMLAHTHAHAQSTPAPGTAPAAKTQAPKPRPPPRPRPAPKPPEPPLVLPTAEGEQLAAAALTHFGLYECEFSQNIQVDLNKAHDGYVDVRFGRHNWIMKPVLSSTGALRLEDVRGHMLMLQIANKSMLMDIRKGQRVVDDCVHDHQREANRANKEAAAASPNGQTGQLLR